MRALIALLLSLWTSVAFAQVAPGTSPLSGQKGGTNNAFMQFSGPASSIKTYALPNASDTIATIAAAQTLTNKTFNCANNVCTVRIGSDVSGLGTGVAAAAANALNASGGLVGFGGALGTPTSGTLTNATGLPISTGVSGLGTGCATFLGTPSSANLRGCLTDEVGSGSAYFVGGALGTPASATLTNATGLPIAGVTGWGTGVAAALGSALNASGGLVGFSGNLGTPTINGGALSGTFTGTPAFSGANFLTLANLAQSTSGAQLLGVTGASAANYAPFTIQGLTNAAPNPTLDSFLFYNHTTGTLEAATASQISSAVGSGVTSLNSLTGALSIAQGAGITVTPSGSNVTVKQSLSNQTLQATFGSPTGTTSTTGAMMGAGATCSITPAYSSRVHLNFRGSMFNATAGDIVAVSAFYGTGTAPTNGQAQSGGSCGSATCTQIGPTQDLTSASAGGFGPFNVGGNITGLTPGTAYWFDMALLVGSGTGHIQGSTCDGFEY